MNCAKRQEGRTTELPASITTVKLDSFCADIETDNYDPANLPNLLHLKSSTC
jgi:hypothetical protein